MYEKAQMDRYYQQLSDYNAETMKNAFPPGFPFHETSFSGRERTVNTRPKLSMPQFPMICGNANNNGGFLYFCCYLIHFTKYHSCKKQ